MSALVGAATLNLGPFEQASPEAGALEGLPTSAARRRLGTSFTSSAPPLRATGYVTEMT